MSFLKKVARPITGAAILGAVMFAAPAAHADGGAPPCSGSGCVGKSPYIENDRSTSCADDATTVNNSATRSVVDNYVVVLRWSAFCNANWAELTGTGVAGAFYSLYWVQTWDGHPEYGSGGYYSPMVDGTQLARVCVLPDAAASDATPNCSAWF